MTPLTEERVRELRAIYDGTDHDIARDVAALCDAWLAAQGPDIPYDAKPEDRVPLQRYKFTSDGRIHTDRNGNWMHYSDHVAALNSTRPSGVVDAYDAAVAAELPRVSHVQYDSHEICKHFAERVRERLVPASPQAEKCKECGGKRWYYVGEAITGRGPDDVFPEQARCEECSPDNKNAGGINGDHAPEGMALTHSAQPECPDCGNTIAIIDDGKNKECACGVWPNNDASAPSARGEV